MAGAGTLTVAYALPGGAYDVVVRGQFAVALWWGLGLGLLTGVLPRARLSRAWIPVAVGAAALLVLTVNGLRVSSSAERTTLEIARVLHHAGLLVLVACLVRRATAPAAVAGVAAGAALICVMALGTRLLPNVFPEDLGRRLSQDEFRLSYPMNYWNALGAWGAMTVALCLSLGAHVRHAALRAAAAGAVPVGIVVVYLTFSRAGALGLIVAVLAAFLVARNRATLVIHAFAAAAASAGVVWVLRGFPRLEQGTGNDGSAQVAAMLAGLALVVSAVALLTNRFRTDERLRLRPRPAATIAGVAVTATCAAAAIWGPTLVDRAWESFNRPAVVGGATAERLTTFGGNRRHIYASAVAAGRANPWEGIGPGSFEYYWNRDARDPEFIRDAHSLYLEAFAEYGWPGLAAVIVLLGAVLAGGLVSRLNLRRTGSPAELGAIAAALAVMCVFALQAGVDWLWESTACTAIALIVGGVAVAARQDARTPSMDRARWPVLALRVGMGAACAAALLAQLPPLASTSQLRTSQQAAAVGRMEQASSAVADAIDMQPWAASPYAQRALLAERAGRLGAAEADLRRSIEREPENWRYPLLLARVLAVRGRSDRAVQQYRRARALRPLSPIFEQRG